MSETVVAIGPERPNPAWPRAELINRDGRLFCKCPYACMAAQERCEFADRLPPNGREGAGQ